MSSTLVVVGLSVGIVIVDEEGIPPGDVVLDKMFSSLTLLLAVVDELVG